MGIPLDVIEDISVDENMKVDWAKFNELMEEQKQRGKMSWKKEDKIDFSIVKQELPTKYVGDEYYEYESRITKIFVKEGNKLVEVNDLKEGQIGVIITEETPFYGEGGGQVGDIGVIFSDENNAFVLDTQKKTMYIFI